MPIHSTNPATNKVDKIYEEMSDTEVDEAIAKSVETFATWKNTSFAERASLLHKVAGLLRENKKDLARLITLEMGKLVTQAGR